MEPTKSWNTEPPRDPSLGEVPLSLTKAVLRGVRVGIAEDEEVRFRVEPEEQGGAPALLVEPPERLEDAPLTRRMLEGRQFPFLRLLSIGLASKALRVTQDGLACGLCPLRYTRCERVVASCYGLWKWILGEELFLDRTNGFSGGLYHGYPTG